MYVEKTPKPENKQERVKAAGVAVRGMRVLDRLSTGTRIRSRPKTLLA